MKVAQLCPTLCPPCTIAARLLCPWDFPGKDTGVGCYLAFPSLNLDTQIDTSDVHTQSKTLVITQCLSATREKGFQKKSALLTFGPWNVCFQHCVRSGIFIFKPSSQFFFFLPYGSLEANIAHYFMLSVLV